MKSPVIRNLLLNPIFKLLNVSDPPEKFFNDLFNCGYIASSSLHGLIFADSFQIPNMWFKIYDKLAGGDFKFNDYYSTTDLPKCSIDINLIELTPEFVQKNSFVSTYRFDLNDLRGSFPTDFFMNNFDYDSNLSNYVNLRKCRSYKFVLFSESDFVGDSREEILINHDVDTDCSILKMHNKCYAKFSEWAEPPNFVVTNMIVDDALIVLATKFNQVLNTTPNVSHCFYVSDSANCNFNDNSNLRNICSSEIGDRMLNKYFIYSSKPINAMSHSLLKEYDFEGK